MVNDLLTLSLAQRLDGFLADGELQVETLHSGSIRLKVYGVERTLVDCFRHCRRLGMALEFPRFRGQVLELHTNNCRGRRKALLVIDWTEETDR